MTTITEAMGAVTGFDELAVEKHFGADLLDMAEHKPRMATRACVFINLRHNGATDRDAYQQVMEMTSGALEDYFEDDPEEVDEDEPETEAGKGREALGSEQRA